MSFCTLPIDRVCYGKVWNMVPCYCCVNNKIRPKFAEVYGKVWNMALHLLQIKNSAGVEIFKTKIQNWEPKDC